MNFLDFIAERFRNFFTGSEPSSSDDSDNVVVENREKIVAFSVAFLISICLWFIVNLSRDFNVNIEVPIRLTNLPEDVTVSNEIPETAQVSITGEGWNIISAYTNPPTVLVNANAENVNLSDQIRNQVTAFSDLNIIQVNPSRFTIETERKATKTVPVVNNVEINVRDQFGLLGEPEFFPDSVQISGADSRLDTINYWETVEVRMNDVHQDINRQVPLKQPRNGFNLQTESVRFTVEVAEFTEAETQVPVRTRNLPSGSAVTYNPSSITVLYNVPIDQYSEVQGRRPFRAYVDYSVIEEDTTGRVIPEIEVVDTTYTVRVKDFQPSRVSYFRIVPD